MARASKSTEDLSPVTARLATMVQRAREARGWTQASLAEVIGCAPESISRIETCKTDATFSLVARLAVVLNLDLRQAVLPQRPELEGKAPG